MIKKFKLFEKLKKSPNIKNLLYEILINDYVICESRPEFDLLNEFTLNNIGQIIDILPISERSDIYVVQFEYIPETLSAGYKNRKYKNSINFSRSEIKYLSDDKSELEMIIAANKFNI